MSAGDPAAKRQLSFGSSSALSLLSAVMVMKMTGVVDWMQDDENNRTNVCLQSLTCGVIGCRQGGRENYRHHRLLCTDGV